MLYKSGNADGNNTSDERIGRDTRDLASLPPTQESAQGNSFVYILRAGSFSKVGHTRRLLSRLTNIRGCCPLEVRLYAKLEVPANKAPLIEFEAHKILKSHHQRGEWFKIGCAAALSAVCAAKKLVMPDPPLSDAETEKRYQALVGKRRGPYKLTRHRSQTLKIGLKYSGPSAQKQAQRKTEP